VSDETPAFLDSSPPHWAANGLAYVIGLMFLFAVVALVVVHVPETVSSPFVLVATRGTDAVRASRSGSVVTVTASEGAVVAQGQTMYVLQSAPVGDRSAELQNLETQLRGAADSLANARSEYESKAQADAEEDRRLRVQIPALAGSLDLKKKRLALAQEIASKYEQVYKAGLGSWVEMTTKQNEANLAAIEVQQVDDQHKTAQSALEKLHHESAARRSAFQELERKTNEETQKTRTRAAALQAELTHSTKDELSVTAPCAGTVVQLKVKSVGAYVVEGEPMGDLACSDERLQADFTVAQTGAARIRPGQSVKFMYDAFPYQRYGVRYGTVRWVSPTSLGSKNGEGFRAFADIEDDAIVVDGLPRPLRAGMQGKANIVVGRRTLITYALEPLRQLQESFRDAPARGK